MKAQILIRENSFEISDHTRAKLKQEAKEHGGWVRAYIETLKPESRNQRGYLMGGLIPLLVYLDGNDYKDPELRKTYFEEYKRILTPKVLTMAMGRIKRITGCSTKGSKALGEFIEKLQDFLNEQYGIAFNNKAISPDEYKMFRDEIYGSHPEYSDFIDYCVKMKYI